MPALTVDAVEPLLVAAAVLRPFEVVLTVPREDGGEPLVPRDLPPVALGCWSADAVTVSATVVAARPSGAVAAVEALLAPELARVTASTVTVRAAEATDAVIQG